MKTSYITIAILGIALFSQTAAANLKANPSTSQFENKIEVNIEAEIRNNINMILANVQDPVVKTDIVKQLDMSKVQLHTNELVQNASEELPEFKFKVVITD